MCLVNVAHRMHNTCRPVAPQRWRRHFQYFDWLIIEPFGDADILRIGERQC